MMNARSGEASGVVMGSGSAVPTTSIQGLPQSKLEPSGETEDGGTDGAASLWRKGIYLPVEEVTV
jgi:hypothetical protein